MEFDFGNMLENCLGNSAASTVKWIINCSSPHIQKHSVVLWRRWRSGIIADWWKFMSKSLRWQVTVMLLTLFIVGSTVTYGVFDQTAGAIPVVVEVWAIVVAVMISVAGPWAIARSIRQARPQPPSP